MLVKVINILSGCREGLIRRCFIKGKLATFVFFIIVAVMVVQLMSHFIFILRPVLKLFAETCCCFYFYYA